MRQRPDQGPRGAPDAKGPPEGKRRPPTADTRATSDPLTLVLPAVCALAAIASIATIHWSAEDETETKPRAKRKAASALRDLETCCMGLTEIFRRFQKLPRVFAGEGASASSPLKFGNHAPRVDSDDARALQKLISDIASMQVLASQNAFDVMSAIEDGEIQAPEELFFAFADCQEQLNMMLLERATLRACVEIGCDVAQRLTIHVRELKQFRVE